MHNFIDKQSDKITSFSAFQMELSSNNKIYSEPRPVSRFARLKQYKSLIVVFLFDVALSTADIFTDFVQAITFLW